ncbi:hypothetical protein [Streptomyces sp. NBC_01180]|uniref:hypothetical protein n=1 Tax=unclassified Streptomyces TaxID=2593676 RepID=UPI00386C8815
MLPSARACWAKRAIALHGTAAVRFFYDEKHIHRQDALPQPVIDTLFGRGAG